VAYEGRRPVFATLVSVGRDRLGDPETSRSTARGTFEVVRKHVTLRGYDPRGSQEGREIFDLPWAFELSSGQLMHAAYWHDRFGIEHTEGALQLSPSDARWIFTWATPDLPKDWHGVAAGSEKTLVNVRK
jgi:lipoprotein-anchoring transpeptidase ErfK/SrfK